jgi:hypothetical protein
VWIEYVAESGESVVWWKRGLSRRPGGFAPSLLFQVGRAAMHHFEMVAVTAFMRTKNRCGRLPFRIGQVTPSVVRIKRVAAMYAGLDLRLGSHIGQGTRDGPKLAHMACNSKQRLKRQRINYFLKLTQPSWILAIAAVRHDRWPKIGASRRNRL